MWDRFSAPPNSSRFAAETNCEGQQSARGWSLQKPLEEAELQASLVFWLSQMEKVEEQAQKTPNHSTARPSVSGYLNKVKGKAATKVQHTFAPDSFPEETLNIPYVSCSGVPKGSLTDTPHHASSRHAGV